MTFWKFMSCHGERETLRKLSSCWCTMVWAVLTGWSTISGVDLARFSSLSSRRFCVFGLHGICSNFFCLRPILYLLVSWAWWDWPLTWLTNHRPSVLWHCWLGHLSRKIISEMTYNVSSGTFKTLLYLYQYTYTNTPSFFLLKGQAAEAV